MNIILVLLLIFIGFCFYFLYRNDKVFQFRVSLNYLIHDGLSTYLKNLSTEEYEQRSEEINELLKRSRLILCAHSYDQMLYSFKKLKIENWFNTEEIAFLKQCKVWLETTKPQE